MTKFWLKQYPQGVPEDIDAAALPTLAALLDHAFARHRALPACRFMGRSLSFGEIDELSRALAAWLQGRGLARGDRVALMMPNLPQYLVAVAAVLRAGMVVVNVNPQLEGRDLAHQLRDSGARAIIVLEHFAATLQPLLAQVPTKTVLVAAMGDLLGPLKGRYVNHLVRRVHKLVPRYEIPEALPFALALAQGQRMTLAPVVVARDDIALLQYTGGTTGVAKGAVLLHRNLAANVLQCEAWYRPALALAPADEQVVNVCALPLHHIYAFTSCLMLGLRLGFCNVLVPNPGDTGAVIETLAREHVHSFPGIETLFHALVHHPRFDAVDWSHLRITIAGGMATQPGTARLWQEMTGSVICEGYGLSETSPTVCCNPVDIESFSGSIGLPLPGTEILVLDDEGRQLPPGVPGEIAIRGPQVMAGYWQRPEETARVMTADGCFRSGDIGAMDERGHFRIVDRKKDLILVSGFNVYPNEVEDVVARMPGVAECAAIGMPDERAGEAVKLIVVRSDPQATSPGEADIRAYCEMHLSGYKRPRVVEFRAGLPKTGLGKVLRRELRESA
ncbi:Long-chain-fatty-acid--CoA ligase [Rubrivivax sp. A210]|uniref:AMP-binding protein n=1 Tax=Rubrivivax sp. A210 TaxID=2772301 RepID=UPI0019192A15|nr:AMP-binding protein [Rubrivivax sp. A210]CAD5373223.1 Long-chain-fatty-acid--CoA ligase [Rubrivivax sp. A210]